MEQEDSRMNLMAALEAMIFSVGDAVEEDELIHALDPERAEDKEYQKEVREAVNALIASYEDENRGIRLIRLDSRLQLCTKNEYYDPLIRLVNMPKKHSLTDVVLETLSIIAYKQPVTRAEIEKIRGVSSDHAVNKLLEYNLIREVGRLDAPGHPILFGTTDEFLRSFGISSMDELPDISPDQLADFQKQAEEEAGIEVPV